MFISGKIPGSGHHGFTLVEILVAIVIITLTFSAVITSYVNANSKAEWSAYSFTAQSLALQGVEQVRAARWEPSVDELGETNFTQIETLDVPASGAPIYATNYISVTNICFSPQLRQLRADCVWTLASLGSGSQGPFTNTAIVLRAPDQ